MTYKMEVAPVPDPLKLIIVTCKTQLNCQINLELLAKKLVLDDQIVGKKLLDVVNEGMIKRKTKTLRSRKTVAGRKKMVRKDFSNQCTVVIKLSNPDKLLNLKIFGNGIIVITGGLSREDGRESIRLLKQKIIGLEDIYQIREQTTLGDHFDTLSTYLKYMNKNYLIFLKFFTLFGLNADLRLDLILNKKFVEKYTDQAQEIPDSPHQRLSCDPIKANLLKIENSKDLEGFLRLVQVFNICHHYFPNKTFLEILDQPETHPIRVILRDLYDLRPIRLPLTFDEEQIRHEYEVTVENYNTMFNCGFQHNREILTQILNDKYKKQGVITSAKFEPSTYQGINVKYISRVLCSSECPSLGKKKSTKCLCKEISFLIFQEGNVIVTGGHSWEQMMDGYQVITNILTTEYAKIHCAMVSTETSQKTLPSQIIRTTSDGTTIVYLNKKKQICENPRNVFLLKKMGLLDRYLIPKPLPEEPEEVTDLITEIDDI